MKAMAATQGPKVRINSVLPGLLLTEWVSYNSRKRVLTECILIRVQGSKYPPEVIKGMEEKAFLKRVVSIKS
jgi:hypothetical protein